MAMMKTDQSIQITFRWNASSEALLSKQRGGAASPSPRGENLCQTDLEIYGKHWVDI